MRLLDVLKKFLDPRGPLGDVISPSIVFKERMGLPIAASHAQRVQAQAPADIERALAPARFVPMAEAHHVPKDRVVQVSAFIEEHWAPVYAKTTSTDLATILLTSQQQVGWQVTQRQSASSRARTSAEQFAEVLQSVSIQASDEFYNGIYPTIPGNDVLVMDGQVLKGEATYDAQGRMTHDGIVRGTMITKGRAEYAQRTKGMVHWDVGFVKERQKHLAEEASRPVRNVKKNLERVAGEVLPMRKLQVNPRYDRRSAV